MPVNRIQRHALPVSPRRPRISDTMCLMDLSGMRKRPASTSLIAPASSSGPTSFCR